MFYRITVAFEWEASDADAAFAGYRVAHDTLATAAGIETELVAIDETEAQ